nr:MAG TPA: hypothetical protein [Caudoviricetes sp.]
MCKRPCLCKPPCLRVSSPLSVALVGHQTGGFLFVIPPFFLCVIPRPAGELHYFV